MKLKLTITYALAFGMMFLTANSLFSQTKEYGWRTLREEQLAIALIHDLIKLEKIINLNIKFYKDTTAPVKILKTLKSGDIKTFYSKSNKEVDFINREDGAKLDIKLVSWIRYIAAYKQEQIEILASIKNSKGVIDLNTYKNLKINRVKIVKMMDDLKFFLKRTNIDEIKKSAIILDFE